MSNKFLFALDGVFAAYGIFWAMLLFFTALPENYDFWQWLLTFSVMAILLYPLIRKAVEFLFEDDWKGFLQIFEGDWKKERVKKRWEY